MNEAKPWHESRSDLIARCSRDLLHHLPQDSVSAENGARKIAELMTVRAWLSARITVRQAAEAITKAAKLG